MLLPRAEKTFRDVIAERHFTRIQKGLRQRGYCVLDVVWHHLDSAFTVRKIYDDMPYSYSVEISKGEIRLFIGCSRATAGSATMPPITVMTSTVGIRHVYGTRVSLQVPSSSLLHVRETGICLNKEIGSRLETFGGQTADHTNFFQLLTSVVFPGSRSMIVGLANIVEVCKYATERVGVVEPATAKSLKRKHEGEEGTPWKHPPPANPRKRRRLSRGAGAKAQ